MDPELRCRDQLALVALREPALHTALVDRLGLRDLGARPIRAPMSLDGVQLASELALYRLPRRPDVVAC
jgi:hypothetical protein